MRLDIDLTVASEQDSAFSDTEPSALLTVDFDDPEDTARRVVAFHRDHPVAAVFGIDDQTAIAAAWASRALDLPHNPVAAVEAAGDKHRQRMLLRHRRVPVPQFALYELSADAESLARSITYPCVLKPLTLSASRGVMRVNDGRELENGLARLRAILAQPDVADRGEGTRHFLVEDYIPGVEVAVEGLLDDGKLHVLALFDKPDPLEGPFFAETIYVTPSRHPPEVQDAIVRCAQAACRALELDRGPVHIEVRYNEHGAWLIELAARPIGGKCGEVLRFGDDGSMSLEQLLLGHALGVLDVIPDREPNAVGVMMVPVSRAGVLKDVVGIPEALAVPGITDVAVTAHKGQQLVPLPEESRYPAFIFSRAETPDEAERAIRAGSTVLRLIIE